MSICRETEPPSYSQQASFIYSCGSPYWSGIAETARRTQCTRATVEQCTKREECECYVVDALGDHALADVLAWMQSRKSKRPLAKSFGLAENAELSALAEEVLAWGLALSPVLT